MKRSDLTKFVLVAAFLAGDALADTVLLDNGDRLSGRVLSLEADTLVLETAYAGELKLPWARVTRVETDGAVRVRLDDGSELDGRLLGAEDGETRIELGDLGRTEALAYSRIAAINPPRHPDRTVVTARVALGGSAASGNSDAQSFHLDGEVVARNPSQRVTLGGEVNEAERDGESSASNWRAGLKYDHFLAKRSYVYANTQFQRDRQADLDLRSTLGLGAGRQFFDRHDLRLALEGGVSLVSEDYGSAEDQRFPGARLAFNYEQAFWQGKLTLFQNSDLLLSLEELEDYLLQTRTGVRLPVGNGLSFGGQVNYDYDAVPAAGKKSSDTALIFKLDYRL